MFTFVSASWLIHPNSIITFFVKYFKNRSSFSTQWLKCRVYFNNKSGIGIARKSPFWVLTPCSFKSFAGDWWKSTLLCLRIPPELLSRSRLLLSVRNGADPRELIRACSIADVTRDPLAGLLSDILKWTRTVVNIRSIQHLCSSATLYRLSSRLCQRWHFQLE